MADKITGYVQTGAGLIFGEGFSGTTVGTGIQYDVTIGPGGTEFSVGEASEVQVTAGGVTFQAGGESGVCRMGHVSGDFAAGSGFVVGRRRNERLYGPRL